MKILIFTIVICFLVISHANNVESEEEASKMKTNEEVIVNNDEKSKNNIKKQ